MSNTGRNEPCPCGSGKKFKKCCQKNQPSMQETDTSVWHEIKRTEDKLLDVLADYYSSQFGKEALLFSWDEFTIWNAWPLDLESGTDEDLQVTFFPWFIFNWIPDNLEIEENLESIPGIDPQAQLRKLPEMTIAAHYLRKKHYNLTSFEKDFIESNLKEQLSFFLVEEFVSENKMKVKDILQDKSVIVFEEEAVLSYDKDDIFLGKAISVRGESVLTGNGSLVLPNTFLPQILDFRDWMRTGKKQITPEVLFDYDIEIRKFYLSLRGDILNSEPAKLTNTDGEAFHFSILKYNLNCSLEEAAQLVAPLAFEDDVEKLLERAEKEVDEEAGLGRFLEIPWLKEGNQEHPDWGDTVLGQIWIEDGTMGVEVNSKQRANTIKGIIGDLFGDRAVLAETEESPQTGASSIYPGQLTHEEIGEAFEDPAFRKAMQEKASQHWENWLDEEIPELGGSPRQAAKTAEGRETLAELLDDIQNKTRETGLIVDVFFEKLDWVRGELGI